MIEIKKAFFSKLDREEERRLTNGDLYSDAACQRVASIYGHCVFKWSGRDAFFLSSRMGTAKIEKRLEQIRKLITIISDLGVPIETYIEIQFDEQMPFLKTRGLKYVPFANLISERAVKRFKEHGSAGKEPYSALFLDVRKSVEDSANEMCNRLKALLKSDKLNEQLAIKEAEVMVRAGVITKVYIYVSPLANCGKSTYLDEIWIMVNKRLNDFEKKEALRTKANFLKTVCDKGITKYV